MNINYQFAAYALMLGCLIGFLVGALVSWYIVDRDYNAAARVGERGEAQADPSSIPAASFRISPKGQFYDFRIES